jgi:hypothetical protein
MSGIPISELRETIAVTIREAEREMELWHGRNLRLYSDAAQVKRDAEAHLKKLNGE